MACCSSHSINRLAITGDTGLPIAVPHFCWQIVPMKLNNVVVTTNCNNSIMSPNCNFVLNFSVEASSSRFLMMCNVSSIGVLVNRDTTSCDRNILSCSIITHAISLATCFEFVMLWVVFPTIVASRSASDLDTLYPIDHV